MRTERRSGFFCCGTLVHRAVGDKLTCIFVDHGLLRKDEAKQVTETFRENFKINLIHINAGDRFLKKT